MYFGKMTKELNKLYNQYYEKFNVEPDFYEELEYGQSDYKEYVKDIKKALNENKELPDLDEE